MEEKVQAFQKKILTWYAQNRREHLPWRLSKNPYHVLVSEIMLQQTQVERVIPYFNRFTERYPSLEALSAAENAELLSLWSGLGYNSRALRLKACAKVLVEEYLGIFPLNKTELMKLPGIGSYTSAAILAFAFNKEVPVIDTNIRRVLIHELRLGENLSLKELESVAVRCIPEGKSELWHSALMDYGSMELTARKAGIRSISKQGKFEGSTRQMRGEIMRILLREKTVSYQKLRKEVGKELFDEVISKLRKENIIEEKEGVLRIAP